MTTQTVKLKDLIAPAANPRRVIDKGGIESLAASIAADGLLQNLIVRKKGKRFEIISGERRYRALKLLRERGTLKADHPVPVEVRGVSDGDAVRLATVENTQREALPPIDEAEAFAAMVAAGSEIADIAAKVGISEATVRRRLAIASLCDEAKQAVRDGAIGLSVAEALTLGGHDQQRIIVAAKVWPLIVLASAALGSHGGRTAGLQRYECRDLPGREAGKDSTVSRRSL